METAGNRVWSPAWEQEWVSNGIARNRPSPRLIALTSHPHPSPHSHTPCNCRHPRFCQASHSRVFFRRSRLFFREAAFFSGGEGCEWGAKQPTVGKSGDKAENEFSGFIPLAVPRKGFSPHIPASRLFVLFHPSKPHHPPQKIKQHSLLVLPPVHTILNFATKFFEMFTKKQS